MIPCLAAAVFLLLALTFTLTSPKHRKHGVAVDELPPPPPTVTAPEPRTPRDISRPYPRPKNSRSKLNRVCPVCETGPETGGLDGRLSGWPAHRTCAEWLGDWKTPRREVQDGGTATITSGRGPGGSGFTSIIVRDSPAAQVSVGDGSSQVVWSESGTAGPVVQMMQQGAISLDEARERLNREIVANWGVPPAVLGKHTHKVGDSAPAEQCPDCGARFVGTPDYLRLAYRTHRQLGCRQSSPPPA